MTNKEKIRLIKQAKKELKDAGCICDAFNEATCGDKVHIHYRNLLQLIPEFKKHKPKKLFRDKTSWSWYWFPRYVLRPRYKIMNAVIIELGGKP